MRSSHSFDIFTGDQHSAVRELVASLPPVEFKVVFLRFWGVFSVADIAEELRIDWDSADRILARALGRLKASCIRHEAFSARLPLGNDKESKHSKQITI